MANANEIDKSSPHYKGEFATIYDVNLKCPNGGVEGDYVVICGWAHYWDADRGTWCVNEERDSYWDELITNFITEFMHLSGSLFLGIATPSTQPKETTIGGFYLTVIAGNYVGFGNIAVENGLSLLYWEGGKWVHYPLVQIADSLGSSSTKLVSQKTLSPGMMTYDCSKGGVISHASLQEALNAVPKSYQKGGLEVVFVQGDNLRAYVLHHANWTTDLSYWTLSRSMFDNTHSNLMATNVQAAIMELEHHVNHIGTLNLLDGSVTAKKLAPGIAEDLAKDVLDIVTKDFPPSITEEQINEITSK